MDYTDIRAHLENIMLELSTIRTVVDNTYDFRLSDAEIILLPDDWSECPEDVEFHPVTLSVSNETTYDSSNDFSVNTYTESEWKKMQAYGAVFIPCSGILKVADGDVISLTNLKKEKAYVALWSSSKASDASNTSHLVFVTWKKTVVFQPYARNTGLIVRLVRDIE